MLIPRFAALLICFQLVSSRAADRFIIREIPSKNLTQPRIVRICLPESYFASVQRRYPVLYIHDGQNVFSTAGTNVAFGWGSWELDLTVDRLARSGEMEEIIMVAIDNSPARMAEYSGRKNDMKVTATPTPFEKYEEFLTSELKPLIDGEYRTRPEAAHTAVMGSSMGGLCSVALAWDHPEVFGGAASLSGAFQVEGTNFLKEVLRKYDGKPKQFRLYLDSGVTDFMGGDDGHSLTIAVASEFDRLGWGTNLMQYVEQRPLGPVELEKAGLRRDKWQEAQTSQHNEFYWRIRAGMPLKFLFPAPAKD